MGWEEFTDAAIRILDEQDRPMVFILWGSQNADGRICKLLPAHPSVGIGLVGPHSQNRVQHQHSLGSPFGQIAVVGNIAAQIGPMIF